MAAPYPERQEEIFGQALELPPEDRQSFVAQECGGDRTLFAAVMAMLQKHDRLPTFFEEGAPAPEDVAPAGPSRRRIEFHGNSRFQVVREVGSGGFGTVFEAFDRKKETNLALKLLTRPEAVELRMFKREFRTLAEIVHPNLAQLYELVEDTGHWFFTMELVHGADFVLYVRGSAEEGKADYARLRSALRQLADVVRHLHQRKMLHRDIKPPNIRVTADGVVKLLDFGLVRDVSPEASLETQTVVRWLPLPRFSTMVL